MKIEKLGIPFSVRLKPSEHRKLKRISKKKGLRMGEYIRYMIQMEKE